jgi:hypothetical protein
MKEKRRVLVNLRLVSINHDWHPVVMLKFTIPPVGS